MRLKLRAGVDGKAKIQLQGRGGHLDLQPLAVIQPVTAQLKRSTGLCWEGVYSAPAQRDDTTQFKDKAA